jgi:hypothetical protein
MATCSVGDARGSKVGAGVSGARSIATKPDSPDLDAAVIKVFISSRVDSTVPNGTGAPIRTGSPILADVRGRTGKPIQLREVRAEIEAQLTEGIGKQLIAVLRNDNQPAQTDQATLDLCEGWARSSELVLAIVTGEAGSLAPNGLGICHAELVAAAGDTPSKLLLIQTGAAGAAFALPANRAFATDFAALWGNWQKFGGSASTAAKIVDASVRAVVSGIERTAALSLAAWRQRPSIAGQQLDWASKPYSERARTLVEGLLHVLHDPWPGKSVADVKGSSIPAVIVTAGGSAHVLTVSAAPDGFGVPDARPYVGYPFRQDAAILKAARATKSGAQATGPLHVIGVFKSVTEAQIRSHIGNADIAILPFQFGYLAHDENQSIQVAYLSRLSDQTAIQRAITELRLRLADPQVAPTVERLAKRRAVMLL